MKLTNPLVLLGVAVLLIVGVLALLDNAKPEPKIVRIESGNGSTPVTVQPESDASALDAALLEIERRDKQWSDSVQLAARTPRMGLSPIVMDMQKQLRDNTALNVPRCLQPGKPFWIEAQQEAVDALLDFMADSDAQITPHIENSQRSMRNFRMVVESCRSPS